MDNVSRAREGGLFVPVLNNVAHRSSICDRQEHRYGKPTFPYRERKAGLAAPKRDQTGDRDCEPALLCWPAEISISDFRSN